MAINNSSNTSWNLISTQTASSSASLNFTGLGAYNIYVAQINSIVPATTGQIIWARVSTNNGSSYLTTGYLSGAFSQVYNSITVTNSNSTTAFVLSEAILNASPGLCGEYFFYNINLAANCVLRGAFTSNNTTPRVGNCGGWNTNTTVNAIQFLSASGNLTSGSISLFGINK